MDVNAVREHQQEKWPVVRDCGGVAKKCQHMGEDSRLDNAASLTVGSGMEGVGTLLEQEMLTEATDESPQTNRDVLLPDQSAHAS